MNAYAVFLTLQGIRVAFRYDDIRETKFLSLGNSLFYAILARGHSAKLKMPGIRRGGRQLHWKPVPGLAVHCAAGSGMLKYIQFALSSTQNHNNKARTTWKFGQ